LSVSSVHLLGGLYGDVPSDVINVYQPPGTDICITFKSPLMRGCFTKISIEMVYISKHKTTTKMKLSTRLYFTYIKPVQRVAYKIIFQNLDVFKTWNDRLGHHMNTYKFLKPLDFVCTHVPREN